MVTKAQKLNVVEGEHAGHHVVVDAFGVDFGGRDPETAGYCLDCHEPLEVYPAARQPAASDAKAQ
jgi:hypothetical protein